MIRVFAEMSEFSVHLNASEVDRHQNVIQHSRQQRDLSFNQEELRILKECNKESFYYRCVPFAVTGMALTYMAVQRGVLKGHPKYGSVFKQIGAGFVGWVLGKFSYRRKCEDKFLHLQNSAVADAIRHKRGLTSETFGLPSAVDPEDSKPSSDDSKFLSSDKDYHSSFGSLNLDTDRNAQYSNLDDRPSIDSSTDEKLPEEPMKPLVTYDELRRKNRQGQPNQSPQAPLSRWDQNPSWRNTKDSQSPGSVKNTYGDTWEQ